VFLNLGSYLSYNTNDRIRAAQADGLLASLRISHPESPVTRSRITAARLQDDDDDDDDKLICHGGTSDWLVVKSSVNRPADRR